jgi:hypothetical protein
VRLARATFPADVGPLALRDVTRSLRLSAALPLWARNAIRRRLPT